MELINKLKRYLTDEKYRFDVNSLLGFYKYLPDKSFLKIAFKVHCGRKLNLENPKTFNEKLQWLKLFDRNPKYTVMVDKVLVKKYVADIIGDEYIIPTLGVWDKAEDIDFSSLPAQFVLKCNHNSGLGLCICKDKAMLDFANVVQELNKGLHQDYYKTQREWPYKNVKRKILAEKLLVADDGDVKDYKFFCYNGKVKYFKIDFDRFICHRANYYDRDGNLMMFGETDFPPDYERSISLPQNLIKMIELSETLSKNFPFIRVDFYEVENKIYFGELTLYPVAGFGEYLNNGDEIMGKDLILVDKNK